MVGEQGEDENEQQVIDDVRRHGWHIIGIEDDPEGPGFAYSIGLFHTLGHPEIIIFGLPVDSMMSIVNVIGEEVRKGAKFEDGQTTDKILEGCSCVFRAVPKQFYRNYFGYASWYYRSNEFPVLQCVGPDKIGRFPWDDDFGARQPVLAEKHCWPFNDPKNRAVLATLRVLDGTHSISFVSHDTDGYWQFLCGTTYELSEIKVVSLKSVVDKHPSVIEFANLPLGWQAVRQTDGSWLRIDCSDAQAEEEDEHSPVNE